MNKILLKGTLWLASDFHLCESKPATIRGFIELLKNACERSNALLLLGDVFEVWIGDDIIESPPKWLKKVTDELKETTKKIPIFFIRGNRDFLITEKFSNYVGMELLYSQTVIKTDFKDIIVTHGDELCIKDLEYQQFRTMVHNTDWKNNFLSKSIEERISIASQLRKYSEISNKEKGEIITDIDELEALKIMKKNNKTILIHGHTHQQKKQIYSIDNINYERWVLSEWDLDNNNHKQGKIILNNSGIRFE